MAQSVSDPALVRARKLFDKQDYKQALKQVRVGHRTSPTTEMAEWLERCTFFRADELQRRGHLEECRALLDELIPLNPSLPDVRQKLPELLVRAGMYDRYASRLPWLEEASGGTAQPLFIDSAILSGGDVPSFSVEIGAIRSALQALESGQEIDPSLLDGIPRQSPVADWKLFVRGLAAYYRSDDDAARANWTRLDANRKAIGIARRLLAVCDAAVGNAPADAVQSMALVERAAFGGELLSHIQIVLDLIHGGDLRRLPRVLRSTTTALEGRSPALRDRLAEIFVQRAIASGDQTLMMELTRCMTAPTFDPSWNRAWALFHERAGDSTEDLAEATVVESFWNRYLADLDRMGTWSAEDRRLARSLILVRVGAILSVFAGNEDRGEDFDEDDSSGQAASSLRDRAIRCFRQAQEATPDRLEPWESEVRAHQNLHDSERELEAQRRLLERFPDHFDSLKEAAGAEIDREEFEHALERLERAAKLRPLDRSIGDLRWRAHVGQARVEAILKKYDEGREHLRKAAALETAGDSRVGLLARQSILERKAGNQELAQALDKEAQTLFEEPTPVLMLLAIEAVRYSLPPALAARYRDDWVRQLRKKCIGSTAGAMCRQMGAYIVLGVPYRKMEADIKTLYQYASRCSRVKFTRDDMRAVMAFYTAVRTRFPELFGDLAKRMKSLAQRGIKQFPDDPHFSYTLGELEFERGPWAARREYAARWYQKAIDQCEQHPELAPPGLVDDARDRIELLGANRPRVAGYGSGFNPFGDFGEFEAPPRRPPRAKKKPEDATRSEGGSSPLGALPPDIRRMMDEVASKSGISAEELQRSLAAMIGEAFGRGDEE